MHLFLAAADPIAPRVEPRPAAASQSNRDAIIPRPPPAHGNPRPQTAGAFATRTAATESDGFARYSELQRGLLEQRVMRSSGATGDESASAPRFKRLHSAPAVRLTADAATVSAAPIENGLRDALDAMHIAENHPIYWKAFTRLYNNTPNIGPGSYNAAEASDSLKSHVFAARVPRETRLGLVLKSPQEVEADTERLAKIRSRSGARNATSPAAEDAAGGVETPRRPQTARTKYVAGGGHWCDGMATGTSIVGCYNRFRVAGPGVAKYNIAAAAEFIRPHTTRACFGTGGRFPGEKAIALPQVARPTSARRPPATSKPTSVVVG